MKVLIAGLIVLTSCLTAVAQTTSAKAGTASVTSTIRVRIPDVASVVLKDNKVVAGSRAAASRMNTFETRSSEPLELHGGRKWILHTERLVNGEGHTSRTGAGSPGPPTVCLVHTSTPE